MDEATQQYLLDTAERYDEFTERYPLHRETSRDLIAFAGLTPHSTVVDLGCGTGVTAEEILGRLGGTGHVTAVDPSAAMLATARRRLAAHAVRWVEGRGEEVHHLVLDRVDLVVCNSAFWLMDVVATLRAIGQILAANGRFAFNLPEKVFAPSPDAEADLLRASTFPALVQSIAARHPAYRPLAAGKFSVEGITRLVAEAGLHVDRTQTFRYEVSAEADHAYYSIPLISRQRLPGLALTVRQSIIDEAFQRCDRLRSRRPVWMAFLCTRSGGRGATEEAQR
jgi:ubiquinone/menaquinone biosynthesis C-methylase UbiE